VMPAQKPGVGGLVFVCGDWGGVGGGEGGGREK